MNNSTEKEVWKDIIGYEGYYQISNLGRVRSVDRIIESKHRSSQLMKGRMKKVTVRDDGYKYVVLYKENKGVNKYIHRLVAKSFIPNPNDYPIINHKDENPSNNQIDNLEWCTYQHNLNYGNRVQKFLDNEDRKRHVDGMKKPIYVIDKDGNRKWYESILSASGELGLNRPNVSMCLNDAKNSKRRHKTHRGYTFEYA